MVGSGSPSQLRLLTETERPSQQQARPIGLGVSSGPRVLLHLILLPSVSPSASGFQGLWSTYLYPRSLVMHACNACMDLPGTTGLQGWHRQYAQIRVAPSRNEAPRSTWTQNTERTVTGECRLAATSCPTLAVPASLPTRMPSIITYSTASHSRLSCRRQDVC